MVSVNPDAVSSASSENSDAAFRFHGTGQNNTTKAVSLTELALDT
jgi:hypothetical protein